ncbi:CAP domain-containing protein, partial [Scheffersomyces xylosifermentans]|uniref:CAP domain-containing protein n=1 Tax=Scheffersomyces xylosifermentans TaxID=1304137 RepID=UPI00315D2A73
AADASFFQPVLDLHNEKRSDHGVGSLTWNTDVYNYAQAYADKYDCSGNLQHSGGKYGENLAVGFSDGTSAFNAWYAEGNNYDYSTANSFDHFTAIVWKDTTQLGCAYKDCRSSGHGYYVICSYNPPGNVIGQGKQNVLP